MTRPISKSLRVPVRRLLKRDCPIVYRRYGNPLIFHLPSAAIGGIYGHSGSILSKSTPVPTSASTRLHEPLIAQHSTCIAVNPVQGCPKSCAYCFLQELRQTGVAPEAIATPSQALQALLSYKFYLPETPLALFTNTDAFATLANERQLLDLLHLMAEVKVPNIITIITKCLISEDAMQELVDVQRRGIRLILYLSYSGLDSVLERGVNHSHLRNNFPRAATAGLEIVHYWRPALPQNSSLEIMTDVYDHVRRYAKCSVVTGLKLTPGSRQRLGNELWPALLTTPEAETAEGVWPSSFWKFVADQGTDYPIFHTNACAIAYVTGSADRFGVFNSEECQHCNRCPDSQRARCARGFERLPELDPPTVEKVLADLGISCESVVVRTEPRRVEINGAAMSSETIGHLRTRFAAAIATAHIADDWYWSTGAAGARPLILD